MLVTTIEFNFKKEDESSYKVKVPFAKAYDDMTEPNTQVNDLKDLIMECALINGQRLVECTGAELVVQDITSIDLANLV